MSYIKYVHALLCFVLLWLYNSVIKSLYLPLFYRVDLLALGQSCDGYDFPSATEVNINTEK